MKEIKLPIGGIVEVPTHEINLNEAIDLQKPARRNGSKVINGALSIERWIADIIARFFIRDDLSLREIFHTAIGNTDWFTFESKWRVLRKITKHTPDLDSTLRKEILRDTKKVIEARNRFAHGTLLTRGEEVYLRYYDAQGPKEIHLIDAYWEEIEQAFLGLFPRYQRLFDKVNLLSGGQAGGND